MMLQAEDVLKREIGPSNDSDVETSGNDASAAGQRHIKEGNRT